MYPFLDLVLSNVNSNTKNILGTIKRFLYSTLAKVSFPVFFLMDIISFFFFPLIHLAITLLLTSLSKNQYESEFFQQFLSSCSQMRNCVLGLLLCLEYL